MIEASGYVVCGAVAGYTVAKVTGLAAVGAVGPGGVGIGAAASVVFPVAGAITGLALYGVKQLIFPITI